MRSYITLFFLIMFLIGTDTFLISPLLPTLQSEFGVSTANAGWMLGAYTLGSAVFALIAGPLSDGWNRRTVLSVGLLYVQHGGYSSIGLFAAACLLLSLGALRLGGLAEERQETAIAP